MQAGSTQEAPTRLSPLRSQVGRAERESSPAAELRHPGARSALVDACFGALVSEVVPCPACGKATHRVAPHVEHTHTYSVAALLAVAAAHDGPRLSLGRLLRGVAEQDRKKCDKEAGGCDTWQVRRRRRGPLTGGAFATPWALAHAAARLARQPPCRPLNPPITQPHPHPPPPHLSPPRQTVVRTLADSPAIFAMQLAWSMDETPGEIKDALLLVGEELDIGELFQKVRGQHLAWGSQHWWAAPLPEP
jgi:hypothetical protein